LNNKLIEVSSVSLVDRFLTSLSSSSLDTWWRSETDIFRDKLIGNQMISWKRQRGRGGVRGWSVRQSHGGVRGSQRTSWVVEDNSQGTHQGLYLGSAKFKQQTHGETRDLIEETEGEPEDRMRDRGNTQKSHWKSESHGEPGRKISWRALTKESGIWRVQNLDHKFIEVRFICLPSKAISHFILLVFTGHFVEVGN
jgi:hypothetical protein